MTSIKECQHILDSALSDDELCEHCQKVRKNHGARNGILPAKLFADDGKRARTDRHDVGSGIWWNFALD